MTTARPSICPSWTSTAEPLARDDARFNAVRSLVSSRSYSASEPRTPIIMRPAAVGGGRQGEPLVDYGHRHPARSRCRREENEDVRRDRPQRWATNEGLGLRDTKLVMFGSPRAGTPVMVAAPLAALDLPLNVLVGADDP